MEDQESGWPRGREGKNWIIIKKLRPNIRSGSIECQRVDEKASIGFPISPAARTFASGILRIEAILEHLREVVCRARACWFVRTGREERKEELAGISLFSTLSGCSSNRPSSMSGNKGGERWERWKGKPAIQSSRVLVKFSFPSPLPLFPS